MPPHETATSRSMIVSRDVIRDLVPLYFDGEASADSRALIENWFANDPDFARIVRKESEVIGAVATADSVPINEESVRRALRSARKLILIREVSLGLAGALSFFFVAIVAFFGLSPKMQIDTSASEVLALAVCFLLAAGNWAIYLKVRRKTGLVLP